MVSSVGYKLLKDVFFSCLNNDSICMHTHSYPKAHITNAQMYLYCNFVCMLEMGKQLSFSR